MNILMQLLLNAIIAGSMYSIVAVGYTLIQATLKFINFQYGAQCALGAYLAHFFYRDLGIPLFLSAVCSILIVGILGVLIERIGYKPLRDAPRMSSLLTSLGFSIVITNLSIYFFGADILTYGLPIRRINVLGGSITMNQVFILVVSVSGLVIFQLFIKRSKLGKMMRAVADNKDIASIVGIDVDRVISIVFFLASALAGMAGILVGMENNLYPGMAYPLLIRTFAASVLGTVGNIAGAIFGAFLIGTIEVVGGWLWTPGYNLAFTFIVLILTLLFKPEGLFGEKQ